MNRKRTHQGAPTGRRTVLKLDGASIGGRAGVGYQDTQQNPRGTSGGYMFPSGVTGGLGLGAYDSDGSDSPASDDLQRPKPAGILKKAPNFQSAGLLVQPSTGSTNNTRCNSPALQPQSKIDPSDVVDETSQSGGRHDNSATNGQNEEHRNPTSSSVSAQNGDSARKPDDSGTSTANDMDDKLADFLAEINAMDPEEDATDAGKAINGVPGSEENDTTTTTPAAVAAPSGPTDDDAQNAAPDADENMYDDIMDSPLAPTCEWVHTQDEATQYYYYWNTKTNQVQWDIPAEYTQYLLQVQEYEAQVLKYNTWCEERKKAGLPVTKPNTVDPSNNAAVDAAVQPATAVQGESVSSPLQTPKITAPLVAYEATPDTPVVEKPAFANEPQGVQTCSANTDDTSSTMIGPQRPPALQSKATDAQKSNNTGSVSVNSMAMSGLMLDYGNSGDESDGQASPVKDKVAQICSGVKAELDEKALTIGSAEMSSTQTTNDDTAVKSPDVDDVEMMLEAALESNMKKTSKKTVDKDDIALTPTNIAKRSKRKEDKIPSRSGSDDLDETDKRLEHAMDKKAVSEPGSSSERKKKRKHSRRSSSRERDKYGESKSKRHKHKKDRRYKDEHSSKDSSANSELLEAYETIDDKLNFLEVSLDDMNMLQTLLIQHQTRHLDWRAGGMSSRYYMSKLVETQEQLKTYESQSTPRGWKCKWDREHKRYFYKNSRTGARQWHYPEGDDDDDSSPSSDENSDSRSSVSGDQISNITSHTSDQPEPTQLSTQRTSTAPQPHPPPEVAEHKEPLHHSVSASVPPPQLVQDKGQSNLRTAIANECTETGSDDYITNSDDVAAPARTSVSDGAVAADAITADGSDAAASFDGGAVIAASPLMFHSTAQPPLPPADPAVLASQPVTYNTTVISQPASHALTTVSVLPDAESDASNPAVDTSPVIDASTKSASGRITTEGRNKEKRKKKDKLKGKKMPSLVQKWQQIQEDLSK